MESFAVLCKMQLKFGKSSVANYESMDVKIGTVMQYKNGCFNCLWNHWTFQESSVAQHDSMDVRIREGLAALEAVPKQVIDYYKQQRYAVNKPYLIRCNHPVVRRLDSQSQSSIDWLFPWDFAAIMKYSSYYVIDLNTEKLVEKMRHSQNILTNFKVFG